MEQKCVCRRDEATELIECYLLRQDLPPHAKLPGEREMCEMWSLNRTTLRAAIRRLTELGLLYSVKGSGTYVAPPKLERCLQDAKSTTESVLEAGRKLKTLLLESQVIEADAYVAGQLRIPEGQRILYLRRLRIMDRVPYLLESNYVHLECCPKLVDYDFQDESLFRAMSYSNIYPCRGRESVGITYATENEARLLQVDEGGPLFYLTGVTEEYHGTAVEFFKSVARPDMVRFSSILRKQRSDPERRDVK